MRGWTSFMSLAAVAIGSYAQSCIADEPSDRVSRIERLFADIAAGDPGCSIGVVRDGELILKRGFGLASVAFDAPNDTATAFEIASGSKSFTAACIALLMDQGKLSPDDDIRELLPELNFNTRVRIRDMLRCESGIWAQFHIMPLAGWDNVPHHSPYSKEDQFTVLCGQHELPFEPGSEFQYGSGDTFLLGILVERLSGQSLGQFAHENLFKPLGMTRTWYLEDPTVAVKNRAIGHWQNPARWTSAADLFPGTDWNEWNASAFLGGGGSVVTCVDDLLKWSRIYQEPLLPRGTYIDEFTSDGTVLGNRFVLDVDAYLKRMHDHPDNPLPGSYRGLQRMQITGGYWGFTCCFAHFPEHNTTIVCLSNSDTVSAFGKSRRIADIVLEDVLAPLDEPAPSESADFVSLSPDQLGGFAGAYRIPGNNPIARVEATPDGLRFNTGFNEQTDLRAISETAFREVEPNIFHATAVFNFDVDPATDQATTLRISSTSGGLIQTDTFERVELAATYDRPALAQFAGMYVSDELGVIYRVRVAEDALELRVGGRRWERMQPLESDEFSPIVENPHNTRFLRFTRDAAGHVDGFSIGFWRIRGLKFDKVEL